VNTSEVRLSLTLALSQRERGWFSVFDRIMVLLNDIDTGKMRRNPI